MKKRRNQHKKRDSLLAIEMLSLVGIAIIAINLSLQQTGWLQNLLIGIGTGLLTSAIVSFTFWFIQKINEDTVAVKLRRNFIEQFKIFAFQLLGGINMTPCQNKTLSLNEYIKLQHRWFHEYYKKLIADNGNDAETELRENQIKKFIKEYTVDIDLLFRPTENWKEGDFSDNQVYELNGLYGEVYKCKYYSKNQQNMSSFLAFASFLEILKRILCDDNFVELQNFTLLKFKYDETGKMQLVDEEFNNKEILFKFAKEFNMIRTKNYKKYYGKKIENQKGDTNNG